MSTTFEVYPGWLEPPSFEDLRLRGERRIQQELGRRGIPIGEPRLTFRLLESGSNVELPLDMTAPCVWGTDSYLWISVAGAKGGTDATCNVVDDLLLDCWSSVLAQNGRACTFEEKIRTSLARGRYWSFRRSAGQTAIVNFAYGILAAVLAESTDGLVYSDDSAWDYERFPATASEVYEWYFTPALALGPDFRHWAEECLARIAADFKQ